MNVDARIENVGVNGGGRRGKPDAGSSKHQRRQPRPAGYGQEDADDSGEYDEHDDTWLRQFIEVAPFKIRFYICTHSSLIILCGTTAATV